jgi:hypothetical protein
MSQPGDIEQLGLDLDGSSDAQSERRLREKVQSAAEEWGLPLDRKVRIKLKNRQEEEGRLVLAEMPPTLDRRSPLALRIGLRTFFSDEIAECTVIDGGDEVSR